MARLHKLFSLKIFLVFLVAASQAQKFESSKQWWDLARTELAAALNVRHNWGVAKNVILFLGDGMGITAATAARIYKGQKKGMHGEEGFLEWERFPNSALIKTYNVDRQVPDSAATATAFLCGVKVNYETIGVDSKVMFGDCEASKDPSNHLTSVLQWAQESGKATGLVTSTRITHATPAASYAHVANRRWECNRPVGAPGNGCPDIADQLVNYSPGNNIKVILGGGRQPLGATLGFPAQFSCNRTDGRDLTQEWVANKAAAGQRAKYITSAHELRGIDTNSLDYLMGLFADSHIPFVAEQSAGSSNSPSLAEMTQAAISMLSKEEEGFFLLVEGGRIDHAYHNNQPLKALEETLAFEQAVQTAMGMVDLDETLMVVTADHSHVLTINGYPERGNDILGFADTSEVDGLPYTTLMFTNGPGFNVTHNGTHTVRADPRNTPLTHPDNMAQTAVPMKPFDETHGGEDVALYAAGPMAHLFHRMHEQHYIPHVMAYAACIGPSAGESCRRPSFAANSGESSEASFSLPHSPIQKTATGFINSNAINARTSVDSMAEAVSVANSAGVFASAGASSSASRGPARVSSTSSASATSVESPVKTGSKFPALSPTLQQLLDSTQNQLIKSLGLEKIQHSETFTSAQAVSRLLGKPVLAPKPHFL